MKERHWFRGVVIKRDADKGRVRCDDGNEYAFSSGMCFRDGTWYERTVVGSIVYVAINDVGVVGISWQPPDPTPFKERFDQMIASQVQALADHVDAEVLKKMKDAE